MIGHFYGYFCIIGYSVFTLKKKVLTYTYITVHILHTPLRVQKSSGLLSNHHEPLIE